MTTISVKVYPLAPGCATERKVGKGETVERIVNGYISTPDLDTDYDVVLPEGCDEVSYFAGTRAVNLEHDRTKSIGTNRNLAKRPGKGVYATTYITDTALGQDVYTMVKEGVIRAFSIEWDPRTLVSGPPTPAERATYGPDCKRVFRRWTLTRYALTASPANPHCLVDGVKSSEYVRAMTPAWEGMESLFKSGRIHFSSAVAAGFPAEKRTVAVTVPKGRTVKVAGGVTWR